MQKKIGAWNYIQTDEGLEAFTLRLFTKVLNWSVEEVRVLLGFVREEMKNPRIHAIYDLYVFVSYSPLIHPHLSQKSLTVVPSPAI